MMETERIEERILTVCRIAISISMVVLMWAAMCGWLS